MTKTSDISDDPELWESGKLGASEQYIKRMGAKKSREVDDALGLHTVTVRLPKELADQLKAFAQKEGLGYQPFIRHVLTRYVRDMVAHQPKRHSA